MIAAATLSSPATTAIREAHPARRRLGGLLLAVLCMAGAVSTASAQNVILKASHQFPGGKVSMSTVINAHHA